MKSMVIFMCSLWCAGCYYLGQNTYKDIVLHPSREWSSPENLTIIMEAGNHNLRDFSTNIKAIATPYYPSVVKAIGRRAQSQYHWSENELARYVNKLLRESCGMYVDWENPAEPVYDASLKPLQSPLQFDSLMFLFTLRNIGWPCGKFLIIPMASMASTELEISMSAKYIPLDNPDCTPPDITELEGSILLMNEQNDILLPTMVSGKRMAYLTNNEETLFIKFLFHLGDRHFLERSGKYYLTIKGFERDIKLEFSTDLMK